MADPRDREYAQLLVGTCLDVQAGWQVLVLGTQLGKPLLEEVQRAIARRGAYALTQLTFSGGHAAIDRAWVREAPLELLSSPAPLYEHLMRQVDAFLVVSAPENTRDGLRLRSSGRRRFRPPTARPSSACSPTRFRGSAASTRLRRSPRTPT